MCTRVDVRAHVCVQGAYVCGCACVDRRVCAHVQVNINAESSILAALFPALPPQRPHVAAGMRCTAIQGACLHVSTWWQLHTSFWWRLARKDMVACYACAHTLLVCLLLPTLGCSRLQFGVRLCSSLACASASCKTLGCGSVCRLPVCLRLLL